MNRFPIRFPISSFKSTAIALSSIALLAIIAFCFVPLENITAKDEPSKMLRHVVLFKFKDSCSSEDVQKVVDAFRGLKSKIPEVAAFEYGTDNSPEGLANGFTHCFLITFKTEADRAVYLPHPAHKAFVDVLKPHLEKVQVIDYWAKD
ncbi:MAG: Dabb family protein [Planctomycetes bacterium]|nr:Dabb family protein [Planctomycetota bacterium]